MDLKDLAHRQLADYDRREPGGLFTGNLLSLTIEDAYALQVEVARLRQERGERIAGYKVGCVSQVMQNQLGLDRPVFGHVFATEVHAPDAVLDPGGFAGLAIEGELAVRIGKDVPDANWIGQHPAEVIFSAFPVIELHNYIFRNDPHTAQELIGNNAIHAGVVMPCMEPPLTDPALVQDIPITVSINGAVLGTSSGRALSGGAPGERGSASGALGEVWPLNSGRRDSPYGFSAPALSSGSRGSDRGDFRRIDRGARKNRRAVIPRTWARAPHRFRYRLGGPGRPAKSCTALTARYQAVGQ